MGQFLKDGMWAGLDIGSVSVKGAVVDSDNNIVAHLYKRSFGQPVPTTLEVLEGLLACAGHNLAGLGVTGSAGELVVCLAGGVFVNEIAALSGAVCSIHPHIRTLVEMGGEDSKLLSFKQDDDGRVVLEDFSMNNLCAAGTGSFLDQQSARMGIDIEDEFGAMALKSRRPPRIAGRCSVFAKSDMIHLQQVGTPDYDIVAGLCYAVARSFKSNVGKGKFFERPVAFFGGVSANAGVVKAMADEIGVSVEELFIPPQSAVMGAVGAALTAREKKTGTSFLGLDGLKNYKSVRDAAAVNSMTPLTGEQNDRMYSTKTKSLNGNGRTGCFIGVDIGSLSTNVVAIDEKMNVLARRYLRTQGRPIQAVTRGLLEIGEEIGPKVTVLGVGTTGSGRYMTGDFIGADVVKNEITAQATSAIHFIPDVDTVFEIGGQDSKYISIENGAVVDYTMNKVCAAGTGSFIEEQAEKIDLAIENEFAGAAFGAGAPGKFGDRCTVFMESDLVSNQQKGMSKEDLAAGLSYSIVSNYLNKVVGKRRIGRKILFQGGVAWNKAVVAAFESVTGKKVTVPPHHDVTGAIGVAIITLKRYLDKPGMATAFKGFDLRDRKYKVSAFECKACENVCEVNRVKFEGGKANYYGARCEMFEKSQKKKKERPVAPDLFAEREEALFGNLAGAQSGKDGPAVGIPRSLLFHEHFPFWKTFLETLGCRVVLSGKTNPGLIRESIQSVKAETCFPIKITHGHVADLLKKGVEYLFIPAVVDMNTRKGGFTHSYNCPLVQSIPYIIKAAMNLEGAGVCLLAPDIHFQRGDDHVARQLAKCLGPKLGVSSRKIKSAVANGRRAQKMFYEKIRERGRQAIRDEKARGGKPVVIISRPYNGCDSGVNLDIPAKLREMGKLAVPIDFLPLDDEAMWLIHPEMYWRSGQRMIASANIVRNDPQMDAILISNFKCGPDSFIERVIQQIMGGKPYLSLEVDEHSADAGAVTRLEAFFDSMESVDTAKFVVKNIPSPANGNGNGKRPAINVRTAKKRSERKLFIPYMCDHAYVLAASLRGAGAQAEVLPVSDQESLDLGLACSSGKECVPFSITTGDIIKKIKEPGFDPERSAFFMPTAHGPCRFGLYKQAQRMILDEMGYSNVPLLSPDGDTGYATGVRLGADYLKATWRGVVMADILTRLLHETRPRETSKGETARVYCELLTNVCRIVEQDSAGLFDYAWTVRERFDAIRVDDAPRPVIGVVGEIYMRSHPFGNRNIIERIEQAGGSALLAPIGEWILYCTNRYIHNSQVDKKILDLVKGYMQDRIQRRDERRLYEPFRNTLVHGQDADTVEILKNAAPYMSDCIEGEAILSLGKAVEFAEKGLSGVINVMPFSCMPGAIVSAISRKVREDCGGMPWLNLDYDCVEETNTQTRLEAFVYQARQYSREKVVHV